MARELSNEQCEVTFFDRISATNMTLYYRLPTSSERIKYTNSLVTRRMNKIESTIGETRAKAGADILMGFKEGAFALPGRGVISSEPASPLYDPDWKEHVKTYASDVVEMLATHVFESSLTASEPEGDPS